MKKWSKSRERRNKSNEKKDFSTNNEITMYVGAIDQDYINPV